MQLFLLCPEDPLLHLSLVEILQELASCQHTVMNVLDKEIDIGCDAGHNMSNVNVNRKRYSIIAGKG